MTCQNDRTSNLEATVAKFAEFSKKSSTEHDKALTRIEAGIFNLAQIVETNSQEIRRILQYLEGNDN